MREKTRRAAAGRAPRPRAARQDGEAALRAALRRWRGARNDRAPRGGPTAWWPRLTPGQSQALLGAAITLALALWEYLRGRLER
jgi:hypothetical protein